MSDRRTLLVEIYGRVQGVWYRGWTSEMANRLNLDGWVRNRREGYVEAMFVGPEDQIEQMVANCQTGPRSAIVREIVIVSNTAGDPQQLAGKGFQKWGTV